MAASDISTLGGIKQEQFLQLLIAGLRNQDPMSPTNSQDFLNQLSQMANVQGMQNLNADFAEMLKLQQLTQGANLIGKQIRYTVNGTEGAGRVGNVTVNDGKISLSVGQTQVSLDQVTFVGAG